MTEEKLSGEVWLGSGEKIWEEHEELFHYTSKTGLEGILTSHTLLATHYPYLNDQEEIIRFKSCLKNILVPKLKHNVEAWIRQGQLNEDDIHREGGILKVCSLEVEEIVDILYKGLLDDDAEMGVATPFIFSFCSHTHNKRRTKDGLLSQWRGYGKEGGFAIVFDAKKLESFFKRESEERTYVPIGWGDVVYQGNEKKLQKELGVPIKIMENFLLSFSRARAFQPDDLPKPGDNEYKAHATCIALYKHDGFEEENEVRIFAYRPCDRLFKKAKLIGKVKPQAEVKKGKHGKPYIELFENFHEPLPIKRIIVGPQKNKEKAAEELRANPKLKGVIIDVSGIPYAEQSWGKE